MKRFWLGIVLNLGVVAIAGIIAGEAYYCNWQSLRHSVINAQATVAAVENTKKETPEPPSSKEKGRLNVLILGTDNEGNEVGRSDSLMLISANLDKQQVSVISIPRDTRVNLPGVGLTKITHANAVGEVKGGVHEGTLESEKAVSDLLGVSINNYAKINFRGFIKAVDAIGGLDVNLPNAVNDNSTDVHLSAGEHHLTGDEALRLAQVRYGLPNGDFDRQHNQFYIISALAHQMLRLSNISKLPGVLSVVHQDLVDTNLSIPEMATLGFKFRGINKEDIKYFQLPGQGISAPDPLVGAEVYFYEADRDGVKKIVQEALGG